VFARLACVVVLVLGFVYAEGGWTGFAPGFCESPCPDDDGGSQCPPSCPDCACCPHVAPAAAVPAPVATIVVRPALIMTFERTATTPSVPDPNEILHVPRLLG
jgi:hypothetical protein